MENIFKTENRIKTALAIRGMKQVELCEKTGITRASLNNWISQRWQPKQTPLHLMAKALDVSEIWLAGYDVPMERSQEQKRIEHLNDFIELSQCNERYLHIVEYLIRLDDKKLDAVETMLSALCASKE